MHQRVTAMQELRQQAQLLPEQLRLFGEHAHGLKSGVCMIGCNRLALVCHKLGACPRRHGRSRRTSLHPPSTRH